MLHDSPAFSVCGQLIEKIWNQGASWLETVGAPTGEGPAPTLVSTEVVDSSDETAEETAEGSAEERNRWVRSPMSVTAKPAEAATNATRTPYSRKSSGAAPTADSPWLEEAKPLKGPSGEEEDGLAGRSRPHLERTRGASRRTG